MRAESPCAGVSGGEQVIAGREFDEFYRSEFARLVVLAAALSGRRAGAEDLVQEAMIDAYRRWDRVGAYDAPRAWVRRGIIQRSSKVARKRSNEHVAHLRALRPTTVDEPGDEMIDPSLLKGLRALPHQQRAAVVLHYLEDSSVREVAEELGVTEGTVKVHLSRARAALAAWACHAVADGRSGDA